MTTLITAAKETSKPPTFLFALSTEVQRLVFIRSVRTATTSGQYYPVRPEQTRLVRADLHGTIFVACDKLTTGLRHDL